MKDLIREESSNGWESGSGEFAEFLASQERTEKLLEYYARVEPPFRRN
jgi:hypothetical protein